MPFEKGKKLLMSMLGVVVDREKGPKVLKVLEGHKSLFNLATLGVGTANSKILGYLGLGETEKTVFFSILPTPRAQELMDTLDDKLDFKNPGHGVAYMTRIAEGCYHRPVPFTGDDNGSDMVEQTTHDLILVILTRGYTEEVMQVARAAGATGGTVLHARGCGLAGAEKFFGVTIQPEKEMIMILADRAISCNIMSAIADKAGPGSDSNAISFSLPVNDVRGIGRDVPKELLKKK